MGLKDTLTSDVQTIFDTSWTVRNGQIVPRDEDIKLGNDAVKLDAAVLYADLTDSTQLVDRHKDWFAASIYKSYLLCAAKIIRSEGGEITAYDGDRIMAVFIGNTKETAAVRTAMKINYAVYNIINPKIKAKYTTTTDYQVKQVVGVDISTLFIAKTGVRGANDLVWVGRAANYAAKLCTLDCPTFITKDVYDKMDQSVKYSSGQSMWIEKRWTAMNNIPVYSSTWTWNIDS